MKLLAGICMIMAATHARADAADVEFFEKKIRPIFVEHCQKCHGEKKQKGGLRLDTMAGWKKGGDNGAAILPGKSASSLLMKMVRGAPGKPPEMPPDYVLPGEQAADLARWIDNGAADPRAGAVESAKAIDWDAARRFWAYQPVVAREGTIDSFIDAKLGEKRLAANGPASRRVLIRRASYDLAGLPPTIDEIAAFESDSSPDAFAQVVDRLLASPRYGEQQARMWLDLARYGEDQTDKEGKEGAIAHAWRYRDWVIEAMNRDEPYDRFVKMQLAADLMADVNDPLDRRALGFIGLGAIYARPNDLDRKRAEEWDDRVDTLTRAFLGLTVSCARCHDHKYDPITAQDYYALTGVIANTKNAVIPIAPKAQVERYDAAKAARSAAEQAVKDHVSAEIDRRAGASLPMLRRYVIAAATARGEGLDPRVLERVANYLRGGPGNPLGSKWADARGAGGDVESFADEFVATVQANLGKHPSKRNLDLHNQLFGEQGIFPLTEATVTAGVGAEWLSEYARLKEAAKSLAAQMPPEPAMCNGVMEAEKIGDLKVYVRGNPSKQGEAAPRRFLRILSPEPRLFTRGSGRLELAEAIADPANPLTARVMVNRVWQQHFGRGIVSTASNFGQQGARPTHPELLDHLAARFVRDGWSIKKLHRAIMLSNAYQRDSAVNANAETVDPENKWIWRMPRRRLGVEAFRDSILLAAGRLELTMYGPSRELDDVANARRTVYGRVSRHDLSGVLKLFDFPAPNISADRRTETTLPQQALFLMNSPFMMEQAKALTGRVEREATPAARVTRMYEVTLSRRPDESEMAAAAWFLEGTDQPNEKSGLTRLQRLGQALLACNEFIFID